MLPATWKNWYRAGLLMQLQTVLSASYHSSCAFLCMHPWTGPNVWPVVFLWLPLSEIIAELVPLKVLRLSVVVVFCGTLIGIFIQKYSYWQGIVSVFYAECYDGSAGCS